jgi:hypothetical protein
LESKRINEVRIQTSDQLIAVPWETSRQLRGRMLTAGLERLDGQFADKGASTPIVLDEVNKEPLLAAVLAWIEEVGEEEAVALGGLPGLRDALGTDVGKR